MKTCLDEGTLQAYLDGELSPETSNGVAAHLAACGPCSEAAREAKEEFALFNTAYAPAGSSSVPTEKLRARLTEAIAEMQSEPHQVASPAPSRLSTFFASLVASLTTFTPRQATAFASLLVAVALAVVFIAMQSPESRDDVARVDEPVAVTRTRAPDNAPQFVSEGIREVVLPATAKNDRRPVSRSVKFETASSRGTNAERAVTASGKTASGKSAPGATSNAPVVLADEKTYLTSIASLTAAIETQGPRGLTPTLRAEYERNLAVVNQAIVASRLAARRDPRDTDAKEFLRAAYQNKVELLSAIADQAEIASSRD
ncbi:MAG: anti-sigma factor family protein [Pyrinomonadaceae bacterium]